MKKLGDIFGYIISGVIFILLIYSQYSAFNMTADFFGSIFNLFK